MSVKNFGNLTLFIGPMCSGKSTELVSTFKRVSANPKHKPFIIAPAISKDAKMKKILPRTGGQCDAEFVGQLDDELIERITRELYDMVFIDEAQFFQSLGDDELFIFCDKLIASGVHVYVAALDADFHRCPWKAISHLLGLAPSIVQLKAWCTSCGDPAVHTLRCSQSTELVDIEAEYEPACRSCYRRKK